MPSCSPGRTSSRVAHHVVPRVVPPRVEVQWAFPGHLQNRWHTPCRTAIIEVLPVLSTTILYWYDIFLKGYTLRGSLFIERVVDLQTPPSRHVVPPPPLLLDTPLSNYRMSGTTRVCHPSSLSSHCPRSSCVIEWHDMSYHSIPTSAIHPLDHLVLINLCIVYPAITYTYVHRGCLTQINIHPWG